MPASHSGPPAAPKQSKPVLVTGQCPQCAAEHARSREGMPVLMLLVQSHTACPHVSHAESHCLSSWYSCRVTLPGDPPPPPLLAPRCSHAGPSQAAPRVCNSLRPSPQQPHPRNPAPHCACQAALSSAPSWLACCPQAVTTMRSCQPGGWNPARSLGWPTWSPVHCACQAASPPSPSWLSRRPQAVRTPPRGIGPEAPNLRLSWLPADVKVD